jgi:predicted ATPase
MMRDLVEPNVLCQEEILNFTHIPRAREAINYFRSQQTPDRNRKYNRLIWIHGPPGTGKSHIAQYFRKEVYKKNFTNKWWDYYKGERIVWIDDADTQAAPREFISFLKLFGSKEAGNIEVKGDIIKFNPEWIVVTSNFEPKDLVRELVQPEIFDVTWKAIERRLCLDKYATEPAQTWCTKYREFLLEKCDTQQQVLDARKQWTHDRTTSEIVKLIRQVNPLQDDEEIELPSELIENN